MRLESASENLPEFAEIEKFADKAEKAIKNHQFKFNGSSCINVLSGCNDEYAYQATLSEDGIWTYHDDWYGDNKYSLKCTRMGILNAFKAQIIEDEDGTRNLALSEFKKWVESLPTWKEDAE